MKNIDDKTPLLIANKFTLNENGGINQDATLLAKYLSKAGKFDFLSIDKILDLKLPSPLLWEPRRFLVRKAINNKNIHVLSYEFMSSYFGFDYRKASKRSICTVWDIYNIEVNRYIKRDPSIRDYFSPLERLNIINLKRNYSLVKNYDFVITHSKESRNKIVSELLAGDETNISVIGSIIEEKFFTIDLLFKDREVGNKKRTVIGFVNNFNWNKIKYLLYFIKIFKLIDDKNLEFHIYGPKFQFSEYIKGDNRIKYMGFMADKDAVNVYSTFDVYLSTSQLEGFGQPVMKAKAAGIPVLTYNGDVPEITKQNTLIWDESNLYSIIRNHEWEKLDTKKAQQDAKNFLPGVVIPKYLKIYREIF